MSGKGLAQEVADLLEKGVVKAAEGAAELRMKELPGIVQKEMEGLPGIVRKEMDACRAPARACAINIFRNHMILNWGITLISPEEREKWDSLLKKIKIFKDNVHGDIWLTKTEVEIMDTSEFQRLQYILQLGPTYLVYRGATHTRFTHSLGTLHMAQQIINSIVTNYSDFETGYPIESNDIFLIRICALLHDIVYITNDHILESEGHVLKEKQWEDVNRVNYFLRRDESNIKKKLFENLSIIFGNERGNIIANSLIENIIKILSAEREEDLMKLEKPFIADIVHNTICADLLDYLQRDVYHTGIQGVYGERMITYSTLQEHQGKKRLVIKLFKKDVVDTRKDVVSEIIEALRLRYALAEKVYFHHTKRAASAMIIKLVSVLLKSQLLNKEDLYLMNDYSLLLYPIIYHSTELTDQQRNYLAISKKMAENILIRNTYKILYELNFNQYYTSNISMQRIDEMKNWELKLDFETSLEKLLGLNIGSIVIHMPGQKMGLKEANVLVKSKYGIKTLEELGKDTEFKLTIGEEIELLKNKHKSLWKFTVFGSPEIRSDANLRSRIKAICEQWYEDKEPVSIIESICNQEGIVPESQFTELASSLMNEYKTNFHGRPQLGISNYKRFCEYVKSELCKNTDNEIKNENE